jgi:uncharacterized membrane protein
MKSKADRLIDDYLNRLHRELAGVARARRNELVEEISHHIAEARAGLEDEREAEIRTLLDRLGDPAEIAAETQERFGVKESRRGNGLDILALVLLLIGGLVLPVVGWFVGVALLWVSSAWTTGEKLIGTLFVPGGLALPLFFGVVAVSGGSCSRPVGSLDCSPDAGTPFLATAFAIVLFITPLLTVAFLAHRMRRGNVAPAV